MKLPSDNSLVLPLDNSLVVDRAQQIILDLADAQSLLPRWAMEFDAPIRDALLAAWSAMANLFQARAGQFIAQVYSPRFAAGRWLDEWGELYHQPKAADETEGAYRKRLLTQSDVVSPNAIKSVVNALVAEVSPVPPAYLEPAKDAAFAATLDSPWNAFAQPTHARLWAQYPDNINPTVGAYAVPAIGQYGTSTPASGLFWIVLPGDASAGEPQAYAQANDAGTPGTQWILLVNDPSFVFDDPSDDQLSANQTGFLFASDTPLLERVRSSVEPIRGGGVLWMAFGDSLIASAK